MGLASVFDKLGQQIVPLIADKVFPDSMKILRSTETSDGKGGSRSAWDTIFPTEQELVPCTYAPVRRNYKTLAGDRIIAIQEYTVTFATHFDGERLDIQTKDRLEVQARGNEPVKLFNVMNLQNSSGVNWDAICTLEDE